jgi:PAS domain S-box-containing protein
MPEQADKDVPSDSKSVHPGIVWRVVPHPAATASQADMGEDFRYQELLQCIFDAVLFTDLAGRILDVNAAAEAHFTASADALRGTNVTHLIAGADPEFLGTIVGHADRMRSVAVEATCRRVNGQEFPGEIIVSRLQHHGPDVLLFCVGDATARVRAEKELDQAMRNLGEARREHSHIQSVLSELYEVNNPLQVIMSMADVDRNTEYRRQVARILNAIQRIRAGRTAGETGADVIHEPSSVGRPEPRSGGRILIADDEALVRRTFTTTLLKAIPDVRIDEVTNGREAVLSFAEHRQALVILDVVMPEMTGEEAFAAIRALCEERGWGMPPCVFCTGYEITPSLRALLGDGTVHTCLTKPLSIGELIRTVVDKMPEVSAR